MSQSRGDRRRQTRGGANAPPPRKRDPMFYVYAGVGILVVIVIAIFAGMRIQETNAIKAAYATPSPGPDASSKPVALVDGTAVGIKHFTNGKGSANTPAGGKGDAVDGITCMGMEGATLHIHTHLALFDSGKQIQVPQYIGIVQTPRVPQGCLYWIHTHDASGIIHVESPDLAPPGASNYTLGMLFDIWGEPLDRTGVAGMSGPVTAYVNGALYTGDLRNIPLLSHQEITLEVGQPVIPPPHYSWPPMD